MRASKFIITRQRGRNRGERVIMLWRIMARRKDIGEVSPEFVCMRRLMNVFGPSN